MGVKTRWHGVMVNRDCDAHSPQNTWPSSWATSAINFYE